MLKHEEDVSQNRYMDTIWLQRVPNGVSGTFIAMITFSLSDPPVAEMADDIRR